VDKREVLRVSIRIRDCDVEGDSPEELKKIVEVLVVPDHVSQ
jgi:hypothetical protein